jgi:hypothetical protein
MVERTKIQGPSVPSPVEPAEADLVALPEADDPTADVARVLRTARLDKGVTLEQAAQATCIRSTFLAALETDEPIAAFPAPAYARFFLREYAQYLRLDAEELVDRFVEHHGIVDETSLADAPAPLISPRARWPVRILAGVSIAVLVLLAVVAIARRSSHDVTMPPLASASSSGRSPGESAQAGPGANDQGDRPQPERVRHIRATFDLTGPTWVRATIDGEEQPGRILPAGRSETFRATKSLDLRFADPAGIDRLRVNGEPMIVPGVPGIPADLSLSLKDGKVVRG